MNTKILAQRCSVASTKTCSYMFPVSYQRSPSPATHFLHQNRILWFLKSYYAYLTDVYTYLNTSWFFLLYCQNFLEKTVVTAFFFPTLNPWSNPVLSFLYFVILTFTRFFFFKWKSIRCNDLDYFCHHEVYRDKYFFFEIFASRYGPLKHLAEHVTRHIALQRKYCW